VSKRLDLARTTGLLYLLIALTSALGHLMLGGGLFVAGDPAATLTNLASPRANLAVALVLGIALFQALAAVSFYRLFRPVDGFAAGTLAAFGLVCSVAMTLSAALLGAAVDAATSAPDSVPALHLIDNNLWDASSLFFGLWLVPMGWLVLRSGWAPRVLGWVLIGGGGLYVVSAFTLALMPGSSGLATALALPASVGELWMIGHLLVRGVREPERSALPVAA
jgi:hypothetical protein